MSGGERSAAIRALGQRFNRWYLLHAPMLWRTRLLQSLLLLSLAVTVDTLLVPSVPDSPSKLPFQITNDIVGYWLLGVIVVCSALVLWIWMILRTRVGEIALRRHTTTVVAVALGSYLWLITPSLFAYYEIRGISKLLTNDEANADIEILRRYSFWSCVPETVWADERKLTMELDQLRGSMKHYEEALPNPPELEANKYCNENNSRSAKGIDASLAKDKALAISDAHAFFAGAKGENRFALIRASFSLFPLLAIAIGILSAVLSYPIYVWRRRFFRAG